MSGELDFIVDCFRNINNHRKDFQRQRNNEKLLSSLRTQFSNLAKDMVLKDKEIIRDINNNADYIQTKVIEFQEAEREDFERYKKNKIDNLNDICSKLEAFGIDDSIIRENISKLQASEDKIDIISLLAETEVIGEEQILEKEKELSVFEMFGIETEDDLNNSEKMSLYITYKNLYQNGLSPIYDSVTASIIVDKDNGNQIVSNYEAANGNVKVKFLSFEGKSCTKDMVQLEKQLRKNSDIRDNDRVYTHWYSKGEERIKETDEVKLENSRIYSQNIKAKKLQNKKIFK